MSGDETAARPVKQCCARVYESDLASRLLGDVFHPGGATLTRRLGALMAIGPGARVLDAASGVGTTALLLAREFGCSVVGVDLSRQNVQRATEAARRLGLSDRVAFQVGDAEALPVRDASIDAIVCECAFCTFPDKEAATREFARVLKPGGSLGLSDITRSPLLPGELDDLMAWIACLADARPLDGYVREIQAAGFQQIVAEPHDEALTESIETIRSRLFAAELLSGLRKIDLEGIDLGAAGRLARQALTAVSQGRLGYAVIHARSPMRGRR